MNLVFSLCFALVTAPTVTPTEGSKVVPGGAPGYVQWSSNDANDVRRLSAETNTTLNFMVRPTSGKESKESYLVSDYAEIRVTYTPGQQ